MGFSFSFIQRWTASQGRLGRSTGETMKTRRLIACLFLLGPVSGCELKEIRSKSKFGPEFRHKGADRTNNVRWYVQQGFDFKWDKGLTTGITYRRRDTDGGTGDNDNGVWIDFSFPVWKAGKKPDATAQHLEELERRLIILEASVPSAAGVRSRPPATNEDDPPGSMLAGQTF